MNAIHWAVIVGGLAAIAWINWYFFLAERATAVVAAGTSAAAGEPHAEVSSAMPQVIVTVAGGYSPAAVRVPAGRPVRLVFDRRETSGCSEEVVIPDFGIRRFLPANQQTPVEFTPERAGSHEFTCGMGMLRGRITVDEREG